MIDFVSLRRINNHYGREFGDRVLKAFVLRVKNIFDYESIISRYDNRKIIICFSGYEIEDLEIIAGRGIKAKIDNQLILLGNKQLLEENNISIKESHLEFYNERLVLSNGVIFASIENESIGSFALEDELKENAKELIENLKKRNIKAILLTGDNKITASKIASKIGIDEVYSEVIPTQKYDVIKNSDGSYNLDIVNSGAKPYFDKYTWDPRFSHTIVAPGQPWKYDPDLLFHSTATRDPITYSFLKPIKDMPHPDCGCIAYDGWQFNSMNKKMIRYDDVLLWKAEILIQLDREMEALPYINQIRTRAANSLVRLTQADGSYTMNYHIATYQPGINCNWTKDFAWKALMWENRLEFACEGHRFFDLQRWGLLEKTMNEYFAIERTRFDWFNDARFTAGRDEYFPISQPQMNYSKGNYTQNPGY